MIDAKYNMTQTAVDDFMLLMLLLPLTLPYSTFRPFRLT
jgi:hypothetical protein